MKNLRNWLSAAERERIFGYKYCSLVVFLLVGALFFEAAQAKKIGKSNRSERITAHGVCKKVNGPSDKDYFVPIKTSAEWQAFRDHLPSGVSLGGCENWLEHRQHTEENCISEGGRVIRKLGETFRTICRFDSSSCPSGWRSYPYGRGPYWTTTRKGGVTAPGLSGCPDTSCETEEHSWQRKGIEYCTVNRKKRVNQKFCKTDAKSFIARSKITQIGCF